MWEKVSIGGREMNNRQDIKILRKGILSLVAICFFFILAFYTASSIVRNLAFYYFLFIFSCAIVFVIFADIFVKPQYKDISQKASFYSIPIINLVLVFVIRIVFILLGFSLMYFIITTLIVGGLAYFALKTINKSYSHINSQEEEIRNIKIAEGMKKIRIEELSSIIKQKDFINKDIEFVQQFQLLENAIRYSNPTEVQQTTQITSEINNNIERIATMLNEITEQNDTSSILKLINKTRLMIEEKNKIAQLYYK